MNSFTQLNINILKGNLLSKPIALGKAQPATTQNDPAPKSSLCKTLGYVVVCFLVANSFFNNPIRAEISPALSLTPTDDNRATQHGTLSLEVAQNTTTAPNESKEVPELSFSQLATDMAGISGQVSATVPQSFVQKANLAWDTYQDKIGKSLQDWAQTEVVVAPGGIIFYPFAGPDFATVGQMFPKANHYVLVAIQNAGAPITPTRMKPEQYNTFMNNLGNIWEKFGRRGYFITSELHDDPSNKNNRVNTTSLLMAFAVRLGMTVENITPLQFNTQSQEWEPSMGENLRWASVRLILLSPEKRIVTLDYINLDLSDTGLRNQATLQAWLQRMAQYPTLLKAASHLLQDGGFRILRNILVKEARFIVQDETGLDYKDLRQIGPVQLYGQFTRPNVEFPQSLQASLAVAYQGAANKGSSKDELSKPIKSLPFRFAYPRGGERSLQIVQRAENKQ